MNAVPADPTHLALTAIDVHEEFLGVVLGVVPGAVPGLDVVADALESATARIRES